MLEDQFREELAKIKRVGIEDLSKWLDESDFYSAPASIVYHNNYAGGLVDHSVNVLDVMCLLVDQLQMTEELGLKEDLTTLRVCGLLHDVCKVGYYVIDSEPATDPQIKYMLDLCSKKGVRPPNEEIRTKGHITDVISALKEGRDLPEYVPHYKVKEALPMGHGEKSVYIIMKYMDLTDEEALAIRWHMAGFDPGIHFNYPSGFPAKQAAQESKLVNLLFSADYIATYLVDVWPPKK